MNTPFIIAEAGVNHDGDVAKAIQLIEAAAAAGADCVKFQTFRAERVVTENARKANYQLEVTSRSESQLAMLKRLELSNSAYAEIVAASKANGIQWSSTPYNPEDIELLCSLDVPFLKLASISLVEPLMLRLAAESQRPVIISTGMATMNEVREAVDILNDSGCRDFSVLHCTTDYPTAADEVNLRSMLSIREACGVKVGYSDHTEGTLACVAATAMGAVVLEKHLTLDRTSPGPDHSSSSEPHEFHEMVKAVRLVAEYLGSSIKEPTPSEQKNLPGMRRSLVASRTIQKGEKFSLENVTLKRPASGMSPQLLEKILGASASVEISADTLLAPEMIRQSAS